MVPQRLQSATSTPRPRTGVNIPHRSRSLFMQTGLAYTNDGLYTKSGASTREFSISVRVAAVSTLYVVCADDSPGNVMQHAFGEWRRLMQPNINIYPTRP